MYVYVFCSALLTVGNHIPPRTNPGQHEVVYEFLLRIAAGIDFR